MAIIMKHTLYIMITTTFATAGLWIVSMFWQFTWSNGNHGGGILLGTVCVWTSDFVFPLGIRCIAVPPCLREACTLGTSNWLPTVVRQAGPLGIGSHKIYIVPLWILCVAPLGMVAVRTGLGNRKRAVGFPIVS